MERLAKVVNDFLKWIIFAKRFILDIWQGFEYVYDTGIYNLGSMLIAVVDIFYFNQSSCSHSALGVTNCWCH